MARVGQQGGQRAVLFGQAGTTFKERYLAGEIPFEEIDRYISRWNNSDDPRTLAQYLGLNAEEEDVWIDESDDAVTYTMIGLNNIMRATGYPKKAMLTSMVTVVCNIILAPIFIFQFDWGIRGAATATVISQFIGMVWVVSHFLQKTSVVRLQRGFWKMKKRIISSILSIGMSPFLMNVTACVIVIIVNNSLQQYGGDMAIGAYGIINRLLVLYVMIVLGLTMGMQPIVGYNFGAQKHDRVKATLRLTIIAGVCITSTGFLICELFPHAISAIFTSDEELIDIASRGVRIAVAIFPLVGAQIVIGNFFQSIGKAKISIFLSLTRQLLYLLPGLLIFPHYFGLDGIWICMPVSDFFAFVTAAVALWIYNTRLSVKSRFTRSIYPSVPMLESRASNVQ